MTVPIRLGFHTNEPPNIDTLKHLQDLNIIQTQVSEYQRCKRCGHLINIDPNFLTEGLKSCPVCSKTSKLSTDRIKEYKITKINHKRIIEICHSFLTDLLPENSITVDENRHCWVYCHGSKYIPIVISDISSCNQFINNMPDLCWLCVVIDWEANKSKLNNYNTLNFIRFEEVITRNININEQLELLSSNYNTNSMLDIETQFDNLLKPISGTTFESEFIDVFWKAIKEKTAELSTYLNFLSANHSTIINSKIVFMGYAANPDFAVINLREYLQEALSPDKIGEAKRYQCDNLHSTEFNFTEFSVGLAHAKEGDALFILSTNDIAPSVWRYVIDMHQNLKRYKITIIDRDMILLLIKVLRMEDILSRPLTPAKDKPLI